MTIGERIKQKRIELGMSQDELAKRCGYKSRSSINKIEIARDMPLNRVELVAKALECTPGYLMGWDEETDFSIPETSTDEIQKYVALIEKLDDQDKQSLFKYIEYLSRDKK